MVNHGALMHEADDDVAVAVFKLSEGVKVRVMTIDGVEVDTVEAVEDVPLGHKISMRDIAEGEDVLKYGRPIGRATQAIPRGAHVHTHNIRSVRWA